MAYKNKEDTKKYQHEYYLKFKKPNYIPHPRIKKTKEEKLANKRAWVKANPEKVKEMSKRSREKHKEQRKLDNKKWVENNRKWLKEYHLKYNKKWYQENKESNDKRSKKWAKNNPEKSKEIQKKHRELHPEDIAEGLKRYGRTLKGKWRALKGSATKRNYNVKLSFKEFKNIIEQPCAYCGENKERIGVDRIDNSIGYTKANSAPCCKICNFMKRVMGVDEFLKHIKKIHLYNK